jgi:hypothetical protein
VRQVLRSDPFPFVTDGNARLAIRRARDRDSDPSAGRGMPDGVVEQDHYQLVEAVGVAWNLDATRCFQLEYLARRQSRGGTDGIRRDLIQTHRLVTNRRGVRGVFSCIRIRAGQQQQIVEQASHAVAFAANVVERGSEIGRTELATAETRLV